MGRLIDVSDLHNAVMLNKSAWGVFATTIDQLIEGLVSQVSTVEAIPKADYENRLKADMVAMLEDLDLQIDESAAYNLKVAKVQRLIRNKIDKLKREDLPHCQYTDEEIAKSFIVAKELAKLPPVTPQEPKWISTSERLPKEDGEYYATVYDTDENYKYMDIAELEDGIWQYKDYIKVLAWMPLPKPFEPQESEDA